jgi:SAM-dependent methyltransferase
MTAGISVKMAKALMRLRPKEAEQILSGPDVDYLKSLGTASPEERRRILLEMAAARYESEKQVAYASYFGPNDVAPYFKGKDLLEFGCGNGGMARSIVEIFRPTSLIGVDVDADRVSAADLYFRENRIAGSFLSYEGTTLPFADGEFDTIFCFDVFEHVPDLSTSMAECLRVLRPGGHFLIVFHNFYHPIGHHLHLVTTTPFFHYFFGPTSLGAAYEEVVRERGERASYYRRDFPGFLPWERSFMINGMSKSRFRRLARRSGFRIAVDYPLPLGETGRERRRGPALALAVPVFRLLARLPVLEEAFTHRIVMILEKPARESASRPSATTTIAGG